MATPQTKVVKDDKFVVAIYPDISGINLTDQEVAKLKAAIRDETGSDHLFSYINTIYRIIGANFKKPERFLIIPFEDQRGKPHINIHKIS